MHTIVMIVWFGAATPAQARVMQATAEPTTARHDIVYVEQFKHQRTSGQVDKRRDDLPSSIR